MRMRLLTSRPHTLKPLSVYADTGLEYLHVWIADTSN